MLRVLALASYPESAAATRFRVSQFRHLLRNQDIDIRLDSFLSESGFRQFYAGNMATSVRSIASGALRRAATLPAIDRADVIFVQREAALLGPPVVERLAATRRPLVLDLDDPTWVAYDSPTYGRLARFLKWPAKTDTLIDLAATVTCGSRAIADHAAARGAATRLIPTVVDLSTFRPLERQNEPPVVGWVGTHSTYAYLESILPALRATAAIIPFRLLLVGGVGHPPVIPGAEVDVRPWSLEREVADFQEIDIGLYPLVEDGWSFGKSGFKAIQYMAVGCPFVVTPIGETQRIGVPDETHLQATTQEQWTHALCRLLADDSLRRSMGSSGRVHAESHYRLADVAGALASVLREAA